MNLTITWWEILVDYIILTSPCKPHQSNAWLERLHAALLEMIRAHKFENENGTSLGKVTPTNLPWELIFGKLQENAQKTFLWQTGTDHYIH